MSAAEERPDLTLNALDAMQWCEACEEAGHETRSCPNGKARARLALLLTEDSASLAFLANEIWRLDENDRKAVNNINPLIGAIDEFRRRAAGMSALADDRDPYSVSPSADVSAFTQEFLARKFTDGWGVRTLRKCPEEPFPRLWDAERGLSAPYLDERLASDVEFLLRGATYMTDDGPVPIARTNATINGIVEAIKKLVLIDGLDPATRVTQLGTGVPLRNGWLDPDKREFHEVVTPSQLLTWRVPFDYEPGKWKPSDTRHWVAFLQSIGFTEKSGGEVGKQKERLLRQIMALPFYSGPRIAKIPLFIGPSRCGKGTILTLMHALVGGEVGAVGTDLDAIGGEFGLEALLGKRLATFGDVRFGRSISGRAKTRLLSITGGDALPINVKNQKAISGVIDARIIMATNETPKLGVEPSDAFARRFVPLHFTKGFLGREDPDLLDNLRAELPGILKWVLDGLDDLRATGRLAETDEGREFVEDMAESGSQARRFVNECCVVEPGASVTSSDLYNAYKAWRVQAGETTEVSQRMFGTDLVDAFRDQGVKRSRDGKARGFVGVGLPDAARRRWGV